MARSQALRRPSSYKLPSIREEIEAWEKAYFSPCACLSSESRGRATYEKPCPTRTEFQRDRDRIVYSNAFRRLKHKTQVFLSPLGDHYRTRLTHTLEVSEIARTVARALRLNEDLTEAIALGHDLGHTPFGHGGEVVLKEIYSESFSHPEQSVRVVDVLENHGRGLNLTFEVRDGILKHSKGYGAVIPENPDEMAATVEGRVVRFADIMAYLNHDLDDAIRSGVIQRKQVPKECTEVLGRSHSERIRTMINDIVITTRIEDGEMTLAVSEPVSKAMATLRQFLYDNVYRSDQVHRQFIKAKKILSELYYYLLENQEVFEKELRKMEMGGFSPGTTQERRVCDFVASITDRYALNLYEEIFFPTPLV
ncbi:MAG: deoxyguanosinetriphosphate triphosphohydrolase [Deltaproteobacteria bacterium]|nr:deoxyguanosinetriphosphate triphosphohydrolase [Deltaproteobacteria bacterium]MBW2020179.1 deoxyguanosinetriphosphate triphosphohydrolase [Deltaproteobacteria bacterium]MBW2075691.1 deoxyguanosinetriphosphate triphosphohydrolase [Deltaproteobacteria bacterium]RLB81763.1 MAG: deoxyguanosinetriphosphate triphosphohydrolase [Deltaproteobacteria bacterium]